MTLKRQQRLLIKSSHNEDIFFTKTSTVHSMEHENYIINKLGNKLKKEKNIQGSTLCHSIFSKNVYQTVSLIGTRKSYVSSC